MRIERLLTCALLAMALTLPSTAHATVGMNPVAFDARAAGMGGADTALGLTALGLARNPASISAFERRVDLSVGLLMPTLTLNDEVLGLQTLNEDLEGEKNIFPLFGVAFTSHVYKGLYAGLGIFVQGGMGADFEGVTTFADDDPTQPLAAMPSPATYTMHSQVQYVKLAPTLAYAYKGLTVGASVHLGLAKMEWKHTGMQFPEGDGDQVYVPHSLEFESDWAFAVAGRFGARFEVNEYLSAGIAYMMEAKPDFEGTMTLDGMLGYDASTDDFGWASELTFGVATHLLDKRLTIAADFRWAQWSQAVDTVTFAGEAKDAANTPAQLATLTLPFQMGWRDSLGVAVGAEYAAIADKLFVRAGYSWGQSPVEAAGINPLFPAVTEHHIALGLGLKDLVGGLGLDAAFEMALPNEVTSNAENQMAFAPPLPGAQPSPNGYRVGVEMKQITVHIGASYRF